MILFAGLLLVLAVALSPHWSASATTRFVDDDYAGTQGSGNQWTKIQWAINNATAGDSIYIYPGTYAENVFVNRTLNIVGDTRNSTIIDPPSGIGIAIGANNCNLTNFKVTGSTFGIQVNSSVVNTAIDTVTLEGNTRGIYATLATNVSIQLSYFANHTGNANAGIYASRVTNLTAKNNTFVNNWYGTYMDRTVTSIVRDSDYAGTRYGIYLTNTQQTTVDHNHAGNNTQANGFGVYATDDHNSTISSNRLDNLTDSCLYIASSFSLNVLGNDLSGCTSDFTLYPPNDSGSQFYGHSIATSNLVEGKPVYYFVNTTGSSVPAGAGYVGAVNVTGLTVGAVSITHQTYGIWLNNVRNTTIAGLTFATAPGPSQYPLYLFYAVNTVATGLNVTGNGYAAYSYYGSNLTLQNSFFRGNASYDPTQYYAVYSWFTTGVRVLNSTLQHAAFGIWYYGDSHLVQNNTVNDSWYWSLLAYYSPYGRMAQNTFTNSTQPLVLYGSTIADFAWNITPDNFWEGRLFRSYLNASNFTMASNLSWVLLTNVSNVTAPLLAANNATNTPAMVTFSTNVTFANVSFNNTGTGFALYFSSRISILRLTTNNASSSFYIVGTTSDILVTNATLTNVTYEAGYVDTVSRMTWQNVSYSCAQYCDYFLEGMYTSDTIVFDNISIVGAYSFGYFEQVSGLTLNRVNADARSLYSSSGGEAIYAYNGTAINITNSTFNYYSTGLFFSYQNWNVFIRNVTVLNASNYGVYFDNGGGNVTIQLTRLEGPGASIGINLPYISSPLSLSGLNVSGFQTGIYADPLANLSITGSQFNNTSIAIELDYVTNLTVSNNRFTDIFDTAILCTYSDYGNIVGNNISNAYSAAISLSYCQFLNLTSNAIYGGQRGIAVYGGRGLLVNLNTINGSGDTGLYVGSDHISSSFTSNTITNGWIGMWLDQVRYNALTSNVMSGNSYNFRIEAYSLEQLYHTIPTSNTVNGKPIHLYLNATSPIVPAGSGLVIMGNVKGALMSGQSLSFNWYGAFFMQVTTLTMLNVQIADTKVAFYATGAVNSTFKDSRVDRGDSGIHIEYSTNVTMRNLTVNGTLYEAFNLYWIQGSTLDNSTLNGTGYGAQLYYFDGSNITYNRFTNSTWLAFSTYYIVNDFFDNNTFTNNYATWYFYGYDLPHYNHTISASNLIEGKPIFLRFNTTNVSVPSNYGMVILSNVTNATVSGLDIPHPGTGIALFATRFTNITNVVFGRGNTGVYAIQAENLALRNVSLNTTECCPYYLLDTETYTANVSIIDSVIPQAYTVLYASYTQNITLRNLTLGVENYYAVGTLFQAYYGVNNVTIENITAAYTYSFLYLYAYDVSNPVTNVTVANSTFSSQTYSIASFYQPNQQNIVFYHNSFNMTYPYNLNPYDPYESITWNRSYPTGGNYWSNWTTPDNASGALQASLGSDGIVDVPMWLYGSLFDRYPLTDPWPPRVRLNSPANLSAIRPNTTLDFHVPAYFDTAKYSINNGTLNASSLPFDINTSGWLDGVYFIRWQCSDVTGVADDQFFVFAVDTAAPVIAVASPPAGGLYAPGTQLNFTISDPHLALNATWDIGFGNSSFSTIWNISTAGFSDGYWNFTVYAWDTAGNRGNATFLFRIDGNAPVIVRNSPGNGTVIQPGTAIDLSITDAFFQNASWWNGGVHTNLTAPFDISTTGWTDGIYTVNVWAYDFLGRQTFAQYTFTIDSVLPTVTLNAPSNGTTIGAGTTIDLSISDTNFQNASWSNGSAWNAITVPFDINTTGWADGLTNITVRAFDLAGNVRNSIFTFTFDSTLPTITLNSPANNSIIRAGTTLDFGVADANINLVTWNNGSGATALIAPYDVNTTNWADGPINVTIVVTDLALNSRTSVFHFTFDSTPPTVTLNTPSNLSVIAPGITLDFAVSDTNLNFVSYDRGSGASQIFSPFDVSTVGWADATYNVTVFANDVAGNNRTRVFVFTIDGTRPTITLNTPSNSSVIPAGTTLDFLITDTNGFSATWSNGSSGNVSLTTPFDVPTTGWADATFTVYVNATDVAGNLRSSFFIFIIDSTVPVVTLNTPANNSYIPAGRVVDLSVTDAHLSSVTWNNGSGAVALSSPFDIPTTGWSDGPVNITVIATDQAGNVRNVVFHYTMDSTLPSVSLVAPANNSVKVPGTVLDFAVSDTNLNNATWNNGSGNNTFTTPFDVSTSGWADGSYAVTVTATDLASNVRSIIINIAIDSIAPSISLNQPSNGSIIGSGTLLDLGITDLHLQNASWNNGSASNALSSPFDIDTTGWAAGNYTVGINATDQAGNSASRSFDFQIDNSFPAVILLSPSNNSVIQPGITLDFSVVDNDLQSVTYSNGSFNGTLAAPYDLSTTGQPDGTINITITATDNSSHTVVVLFRFTIDSTLPTVSLTAPSNNSVISAGTLIDLAVTDANPVTADYNIGGGPVVIPSPFDIDSTGWADGDVNITVRATDAAGNLRTAVFHFVMDSTAPSIVLTSPANNSVVVNGTTIDVTITDGHSFTATWNNGSGSNPLTSPFDIPTSGWADADYDIVVAATDIAGNLQTRSFHIAIDSTKPAISLNTPGNNSIIVAGTTIDIDIVELHLTSATWSNGSANNALSSPFDFSTTGWPDGLTTVTINATDAAGNVRSVFFRFTFDSTAPSVSLTSPGNNSVVAAGTTLDFLVTDTNLASATWNNGSGAISFASPHDVSTASWADGPFDVQVIALDVAGNSRSIVFHFTLDSTAPVVTLDAPANNSIIVAGTTLAFTVTDNNLNTVSRNNGSGALALPSPHDIATPAWADGLTTVTVIATDLAGNSFTLLVRFTFDSTAPSITINTPANNSLVRGGTTLDIAVTDANFASATWNNGSGAAGLSSPFDIPTTAWADGSTDVTVIATDLAGNSRFALFHFTFDTTPPTINLLAPANNSIIMAGSTLDFQVLDANGIGSVTRNNGSGAVALPSPFDVLTTGWADGALDVVVTAIDAAGNTFVASFHFTLDSTPPTVTLVAPANNSYLQSGGLLDFAIADTNGVASALWNNGSGSNALASPFDINTTGWADGSLNVSITATDSAGNTRVMSVHFTFDNTAPVISLADPANNSVFQASRLVYVDVIEVSLSGASYNNSSGAVAFSAPFIVNTTGWPDGAFNLVIFAVDLAGNNATRSFHFTIDSTPANITLVAPANNSYLAAGTVLDFLVTEPNLNSSTWNNGSGPQNLTAPYDVATTGWADGSVTVTITATDLAGNVRVASFRFTVDSTLPSVTLNFPANNSVITPGTDLDFDILDVNLNTVTWNNGSGANPLAAPYDVPTTAWSDGARDVTITATDLAGNLRALTFHFIVDGTAPTITLVSPTNNSIVTAGTVIDLTVTDPNLLTVTFQNGTGPYVLPSPWNISTTAWADGVYNVTIVATDAAGNVRTAVFRYTFDSTPPTVTLVAPANNSYLRSGGLIDLNILDLTALTVTWDIGGGPNALVAPFDINTTGFSDGSTNFTIIAQDAVGLRTTRIFHFTFDTVLPTVALLSPANNSVITPGFLINISISDLNLNTATWDNGGGQTTFATAYNISTSGWADGQYNITVDATDLAGNVRTRVFHFTVDSAIPTITLVSPTNNSYIVAGAAITLTITDANLNTATWDDGGGSQPFSTQWTVSTAGYADGSWNFTIIALDLAGNSRTRVFHFTIDSTSPTVNLLNPVNNSYFGAGTVINFTISDTNFNAAGWDDGTGPNTFATNWNISTAGWADGSRNITVNATDLAGNLRSRVFHFTVDSTLPTVTLNSPSNDTHVVAGAVLTFTITDVNLNSVSYDVNGGGANTFATQWQISTAGWLDGSYNISVRADDRTGNLRINYYRFWVDSTAPVVSINAASPANNSYFNQTTTASVRVDIVEAHLASATWNTGGGPTTFTAPFSVTVSSWADGSYNMTVRATDRAGTLTTFVYHFTLDTALPLITLVSPANDTHVVAGANIDFTIGDTNLNTATYNGGTAFATQWRISTTGWADGSYNISVRADDRAGNVVTNYYRFWVDSTAPVVSINAASPANNSYFNQTTTASVKVDIVEAHLASATWNTGAGPTTFTAPFSVTVSSWADGSYNMTVRATDRAGTLTTFVYHFTLDTALPTIALVTPNNDTHLVAGANIDFTVADINLNTATWNNGSGVTAFATQWRVSTAGWLDGSYNISVRADDRAGNAFTGYFRFWLDSTPPVITLNVITPANNSYFDPQNFTTAQFDVVEAHLASATWNIGGGPQTFSAPFAVSVLSWAEGTYNMSVRVVDRAGENATFLYHFTLDSLEPTINNTAWEGTYFANGTVINGTLFDTNLLWATRQVDAGATTNGSFTSYNVDTTGLAELTHTLRVQAMDRAGHMSVRVFLFYIDSFAPDFVQSSFTPANGSQVRPGTALNFQVDDDYLLSVTWRRVPGATLSANGTGPVKAINTTAWVDGVWNLTLTATDRAGHITVQPYSLIIDSAAPVLPSFAALPLNNSFFEDVSETLNASSASDGPNPLPSTAFVWDFSPRLGPLAVSTLTGEVVQYVWDTPGVYTFALTVTDPAGNAAGRTYNVNVLDTTPPVIALSVPLTADEDAGVLLDGSATTDNDPTFLENDLTCAAGVFTITGPNGYTGTVLLTGGQPSPSTCLAPTYTFPEPGTYTVRLDLADKATPPNTNSTARTISIHDRTAPVLSGVAVPSLVNEGANVSFNASQVTDNDLGNVSLLSYSWVITSLGSPVATYTTQVAARMFATSGGFLVNLTVTDLSGNRASREFPLRVNDIPQFTGSVPTTVLVGQLVQVDVTVADTDSSDTHNVTVLSPTGATVTLLSGGIPRISWTPTDYGRFDFAFNLSDGYGFVIVNRTILVVLAPDPNDLPPRFTSTALQELQAGVQYQYDANAVDPEGKTNLYYDLVVSPVGMSIDSVTGIVTWSHGLTVTTSTQTFTVHISAWDGRATGYQNFTVQLRAAPSRPPVIDNSCFPPATIEQNGSSSVAFGSCISDPDPEDTIPTMLISVESSNLGIVTAVLSGSAANPSVELHGEHPGAATITVTVRDQAGKTTSKTFTVTVTAPTTTGGGGGEGGLGILPFILLGGAGAGLGGFFLVARSRKKKDEKAQAAGAQTVSATSAATLAAGAGTVVVTPEVVAVGAGAGAAAALAAESLIPAGPIEKKITFTIEGLFVIYKDGRLLYAKTDMGQAKFEDPELVSSMFTAVTSFIKDSFQAEGELNKMGYGDNQIIIERGRSVFISAIVFGEPDQDFHDAMKAAVENIELSYAGMIEEWDGLMDHFSDMETKLAGITGLTAGITRREVQFATTKQEVQMLSELEFFQGFVRLKCGIKNNTQSVITKATVDIEYNEDVLRLARVEPAAYRTSGAKVLLGVLNPGEKSSVAYYFDPQICTESQIDGVCRYRDASGVLHTVSMKTRKAEVVCPLFFTKEHANTAMLKRLVESELGEKDSKIFEIQKIPPYIKHKDVFDLIKSVVNAHDVQMVREFTKFNPFQGEAWFYGETKVKNYKIVIRATVIEETNVIEFFAASTNMKAITGLLAEFNHTLNSMVIEKYSDLKIAQVFDSATKAEIEKKSLMSNMSSADLAGGETDQGAAAGTGAPPAEPKGDSHEPDLGGPEADGKKDGDGSGGTG